MSDVDDDGDEIAIDEDMEPESPDGSDPVGDGDDDDYDDGDGDDAVAAGGPITRTIGAPRSVRPISDKTRQLAKEMAAKLKAKGQSVRDEDLEPMEHDDLPADPDPVLPPPAGGRPDPASPSGSAASPQTPAGAAPPAPQLDPEVTRLRDEYGARLAELDAREQRLTESERTGDLASLAEAYFERGAPAIVEILKKWEGTDGDDLKDAIADLVSDLTIHLGVEVPDEVKDRLEAKRTRKQVKRMRDQQSRAEQERAERAKIAQDEESRVRVKGILQQEIVKPEHAQSYPWLSAEPNAGEIIFDTVEAAHKKDGTRLTWQEAAKRANDYLQKQSAAWFDKRRHLLTTAPGQGGAASVQQQRSQGDPQVRRSQAQPPRPPAPPPPASENQKWDPEAHRREVKNRHRGRLRAAFTEQEE